MTNTNIFGPMYTVARIEAWTAVLRSAMAAAFTCLFAILTKICVPIDMGLAVIFALGTGLFFLIWLGSVVMYIIAEVRAVRAFRQDERNFDRDIS